MGLIIRNGLISNCEYSYKADILVENGEIAEIGRNIPSSIHDVIDAEGKLVLPGGVDVHTHMDLDLGKYRAVDDFYTGTKAAAYGGTTTIVDHISFGPNGCTLHHQINEYHKLAKNKSIIDYSFHGVVQHVSMDILEEMESLVKEGITSFKIYMTYDNMLHDEDILKILLRAKELGVVIAVHAENHGAIQYLRQYYKQIYKTTPIYHALSRPDSTEAEAISRMIYLSEIAGYPHLYFVHVSTKKGLNEIISARQRGVKNIYCETCVQYLTLTEDCYKKENNEGLKYIMAPPLRKSEDVEFLWKGIENNDVDVIATDHCPFYLKNKLDGKNDFSIAPGGVPGVEERMEIVLTEGIKRGLTINNLINKLSTKPAKIFGLFPTKGSIQIGMDGDIVILKQEEKIIKNENRHSAVDYTTYDGFKVNYVVETTIQRGNIIIQNEKMLANKGDGEFLKRSMKNNMEG
ncbi:dihydropyrimidinase [Sedimentibacter acidaminivorans]|uniref:Dihydropyrimidinase n=1 Tax=Sedimentibacter acidaminivorans TaxID=913099 RepID=A0ABS4GDL0_9FIRM|nr:dihydropyrimidinase [Sedimentibacter acidaminivorans]MBP1925773.1 dihydropyrimidinase [Sedimentibacter acidaminivorans]